MKTFFISLLLSLGLVLSGLSLIAITRAQQSTEWASVNGQVIESGISVTRISNKLYAPQIRYRYQVDGTEFQSTRLVFAGIQWAGSYEHANEMSNRYPPGRFITVRYHAQQPSQSVIIPGIQRDTVALLLIGVTLVLAAAIVYFSTRKKTAPV